MQYTDYVINYVFRHDDLLTCNFICMIEVFSIEDNASEFEYTTVLGQFLRKSTFKVNVVRKFA